MSDGKRLYTYEYARPGVAASVAVFDRARQAFLLVERGNEPYAGRLAFPGGFIEAGKEDIRQTAAREVLEETGVAVAVEDLIQVDLRSGPDRDPRDHVIDVGFYAEVENARAKAGDDAASVRWASPVELDGLALAFDHNEMWKAVARFRAQRNGE
jgi:8-oxo-dGTP diphosphatase